jgi:hypothetical protein
MDVFFKDKNKVEDAKKEENKKEEEENLKKKDEDKKDDGKKGEGDEDGDDYEDKLEGQIGGQNDLKQTIIKKIEYDMSETKKQVNMRLEDKVQMELMRRWHVKIYNIYITPHREMIDPFLQFTIGGDYSVDVFSTKKGDTYKVPKGNRGFADKTEVLSNVDKLVKAAFDKTIDIEMRMSYSMINSQKMMIELWDYNTIWMNSIKGYETVPLINIVGGDINMSVDIVKRVKNRKNPSMKILILVYIATVDFKCIFQEIWDYKLTFAGWKTSTLLPPKKAVNQKQEKYPSPSCEITLLEPGCMAPQSVTSQICQNTE